METPMQPLAKSGDVGQRHPPHKHTNTHTQFAHSIFLTYSLYVRARKMSRYTTRDVTVLSLSVWNCVWRTQCNFEQQQQWVLRLCVDTVSTFSRTAATVIHLCGYWLDGLGGLYVVTSSCRNLRQVTWKKVFRRAWENRILMLKHMYLDQNLNFQIWKHGTLLGRYRMTLIQRHQC